jgi:hypothetical protein
MVHRWYIHTRRNDIFSLRGWEAPFPELLFVLESSRPTCTKQGFLGGRCRATPCDLIRINPGPSVKETRYIIGFLFFINLCNTSSYSSSWMDRHKLGHLRWAPHHRSQSLATHDDRFLVLGNLGGWRAALFAAFTRPLGRLWLWILNTDLSLFFAPGANFMNSFRP